jgi:hypothetical protein
VKADFNNPFKPYISNQNVKRERNTSSIKNYDSWNKAKNKLADEEFSNRRPTNACMSRGEVGQKFCDCPKPKP